MVPAFIKSAEEPISLKNDTELPGPFVIVAGHRKKTQYRGQPIGEWGLRSAFMTMIKGEDMDPRITIYSMRHTYATSALRSGVDIATVQRRLGHSDIRTTMGYLRELEPEQRPMDKLPY